jgi:hypothetical protein
MRRKAQKSKVYFIFQFVFYKVEESFNKEIFPFNRKQRLRASILEKLNVAPSAVHFLSVIDRQVFPNSGIRVEIRRVSLLVVFITFVNAHAASF